MRILTVRWASVAGLMVFVLPACGKESPAHASPTVSLSRTPDGSAIAGATQVVFTASVSDASGGAVTVSWDLGDGQKASGASVVHVYATEGVFPVAVTATDGDGGVTTVGSSITVGSLVRPLAAVRRRRAVLRERFQKSRRRPSELGGRPFSVPDQGLSRRRARPRRQPRTIRFDFTGCDWRRRPHRRGPRPATCARSQARTRIRMARRR